MQPAKGYGRRGEGGARPSACTGERQLHGGVDHCSADDDYVDEKGSAAAIGLQGREETFAPQRLPVSACSAPGHPVGGSSTMLFLNPLVAPLLACSSQRGEGVSAEWQSAAAAGGLGVGWVGRDQRGADGRQGYRRRVRQRAQADQVAALRWPHPW